jgi:hypothetical protein
MTGGGVTVIGGATIGAAGVIVVICLAGAGDFAG